MNNYSPMAPTDDALKHRSFTVLNTNILNKAARPAGAGDSRDRGYGLANSMVVRSNNNARQTRPRSIPSTHSSAIVGSIPLIVMMSKVQVVAATSTEIMIKKSRTPSDLSGGAIAGVVIGVIIGLCIFATAIYFFLRQRRRHSRLPQEQKHTHPQKPLPAVPTHDSEPESEQITIVIPDDKVAIVPNSPGPSKIQSPVEAGGRELRVERYEMPASPAKLMEWPDVEHPPPQIELDAGNDRGDMAPKPSVEMPA